MLPGPSSRSRSAPETRTTRPRARPIVKPATVRVLVESVLVMEDLLDGLAEVAGDREREGEGGVVAARLERVDRLAGHPQGGAEGGLRQALLLAQPADLVLHVAPCVKFACHDKDA